MFETGLRIGEALSLFIEDIIPSLIRWYSKLEKVALISPILYTKNMKSIDYTCARKNISYNRVVINMFLIPLEFFFHLNKKYNHDRYLLIGKTDYPEIIPIDLPSGSCMFINKEIFAEMSFFDPNTFLYYEENILCEKIKKRKLHNYIITSIKCIHIGAQSTSSSNIKTFNHSKQSQFYYFTEYCNINFIQKILYKIALAWSELWVKLYLLIKKYIISNN